MNTKARSTLRRTLWSMAALLWVTVFTMGQASAGTILGSAHDFSLAGWAGGEICIACHTPHNADTTVAAAPLWNHEITATVFTLYTSPTLDAGAPGQPAGASKLCLSCHDGTVAIDSFGGLSGSIFMGGAPAVGSGGLLNDDHPISFTYDAALSVTDQGLYDPVATAVTIGTGGTRTSTGTIQTEMLIGDQVECASCHDVHNTFTVPSTQLLKVTNAASALCLTCHNK